MCSFFTKWTPKRASIPHQPPPPPPPPLPSPLTPPPPPSPLFPPPLPFYSKDCDGVSLYTGAAAASVEPGVGGV